MNKFIYERIFWGSVNYDLVKHTRTGALGHAIFKLLLQEKIEQGFHAFVDENVIVRVVVKKSLVTVYDYRRKLMTRFFYNKPAGMENMLQSAFVNIEELS